MTVASVIDLAQVVMLTAFWIALPLLGISMAVGLIMAVLQAATQVQETSLTFLPKIFGMGLALIIFGDWILNKLIAFTAGMITGTATLGGG